MIDALDGLSRSLNLLGSVLLLFQPLGPFLLLLAVFGDPVDEGAQVLAFECENGGLGENGTAAHVDETGVLRVVLHLNMI